MPDGTERFQKSVLRQRPRKSLTDPEDRAKLARVRRAFGSRVALVWDANQIHDLELRDAALGNLVKQHIRDVLKTPARMSQFPYEQAELHEIANMMTHPSKRAGMLKRVAQMLEKNK